MLQFDINFDIFDRKIVRINVVFGLLLYFEPTIFTVLFKVKTRHYYVPEGPAGTVLQSCAVLGFRLT